MEVGLGEPPDGTFNVSSTSESLVERLASPVLDSGRNITLEKSFTSISLATSLLSRKTTMVGSFRKNDPEVPPEFSTGRGRPIHSSLIAFFDKCSLVSYIPKKSTSVLVLSTLHRDRKIDEDSGALQKPEAIAFYDRNKGGVDVVDELQGSYSVSRETRRWPMVIFYGILNIAGINAQIIYRENMNMKITRRAFLTDLAKNLAMPHLIRRASVSSLSLELRGVIKKIAKVPTEQAIPEDGVIAGYCAYCKTAERKRSKKRCVTCRKFICPKHTVYTCNVCEEASCRSHLGVEEDED